MKPFDLVELRPSAKTSYQGILSPDDRFVFLGEINQMPGHGVFVVVGSSKIYAGYHIDSFDVVDE